MEGKSTEMLNNELKKAQNLEQFLESNAKLLKPASVPDYLIAMMIAHDTEKNDVIARAQMTASYAYQIFEGRKNASRDKLIQLALGFPLTIEETDGLLRAGGCSELYVRSKRDALIMFALGKQYSLFETNELLEKNNLEVF